jgi:hypothetical protein
MIIVPALRRAFPNDNQKGWDFHPNLSTVILSVTLMLRTSPVLFESGTLHLASPFVTCPAPKTIWQRPVLLDRSAQHRSLVPLG